MAGLRRLHVAQDRRIAIQRLVCPRQMVVFQVVAEQSFQMGLVEHDHVVEQLPADRANQAFDVGILPRAARWADDFVDTEIPNSLLEDFAVNAIAIAHQKPWSQFEREGLDYLLGSPCGQRVRRHVEVDNVTTVEKQHHEAVQGRNVAVGTTKKSMAAVSARRLARNVFQVGDGGLPRRDIYRATVDSASSWPISRGSA